MSSTVFQSSGGFDSGTQDDGRKRYSRVCTTCRRKKTRCDKVKPCSQCLKSKSGDTCEFEDGPVAACETRPDQVMPYVVSAKNPQFDTRIQSDQPRKRAKTDKIELSVEEFARLNERIQSLEKTMAHSASPHAPSAPSMQQATPPEGRQFTGMAPFAALASASVQAAQAQYHAKTTGDTSYTPLPASTPPHAMMGQPTPPTTSLTTHPFGVGGLMALPNNPRLQSSHNSTNNATKNQAPLSGFLRTLGFSTDAPSGKQPHPFQDYEETINFYEGYNPLFSKENYGTLNFGPFSWTSLMHKDPNLSLLWKHVTREAKGANVCALSYQTGETTINEVPQADGSGDSAFQKKAHDLETYEDALPYDPTRAEKIRRALKTKQSSSKTEYMQLGLNYNEFDPEAELVVSIQRVLPKKRVIWKLIHRFFTYMYPYMPIIDEAQFTADISAIIGVESQEDVSLDSLVVSKRIDIAHLGILLIVLRLAYLSLFYNNPALNEKNLNSSDSSPRAQEIKYLMLNPINIESFDLAKQALDQFQIFRKFSFVVLQLAMCVRVYTLYAPEEGDLSECEGQVLSSVINQMAFNVGLNRDPGNFPDMFPDKKQNNLQRKMWYMICMWDLHGASTSGTQLCIDPVYADTRFPFYEEGNENISDHVLEHLIIDSFNQCASAMPLMRKILHSVLNVSGRMKMHELCSLLDSLELQILNGRAESLGEILKQVSSGVNYHFNIVYPIKVYLFTRSFMLGIYTYIFMHYEQSKNSVLCSFYLKKLLGIMISDVMPHYCQLLFNSTFMCDLVINPALQSIMARAVQFNCSLVIRCNFKIYSMRHSPDHATKQASDPSYAAYFNAFCRLSSCITRACEVSIAALSKLSSRYYFAWRVSKAHTFMLRQITTNEFYHKCSGEAATLNTPAFTHEQAEEIIAIYESSLQKLGACQSQTESVPSFMTRGNSAPTNGSSDSVVPPSSDSGYPTTMYKSASSSTTANTPPVLEVPILDFNVEESEDVDKWWFNLMSQRQLPQTSGFDDSGLFPAFEDFSGVDMFSELQAPI
ncbi:multidrug resistance regulator 1 [Diutina catenulata]